MENVAAPGAPGSHLLFIDWPDARRGVSYRVIIVAVPGNQEVKNEIVQESEATFNDLPAGQVKITIAARNSKGGESAPSAPVTATVP